MKDLEIIKKFQGGELETFSKLYDKYIDEIYKFVYLKTSNNEVSEDIVSESFLSAYEKLDTFSIEEGSNFRAWMYKIAYNKVVNFYKIKDRTTDVCEYLDLSLEEDIGKNIDDKAKLEEIQNFLTTIKQRDKEILINRIWNDLSYNEISEIMGVSVDNCKKIVSRTLKSISANLMLLLCIIIFM